MNYLVISLKWTKGDNIVWWRPDAKGYTAIVDCAGRYSQAEIEAHPGYYNNGDTSIAVPEDVALRLSARIVINTLLNLEELRASRLGAGLNTAGGAK